MAKIRWMPALLLILGPIWVGCESDHSVNNNCDHYAEDTFSFTVDLQNHTRFRLAGITGGVEVTGLPGAEAITISGRKRVGASSTAEARAHLDDLQVEMQDTDEEVFVWTVQSGDAEGRCYVVDYTITLPPELEVQVSEQTGNVTVDDTDGSVRATVVTGNVTLDRITGDADIDVTTGNITLSDFNGSADVDLTTGNLYCLAFLPLEGVIDLKTVTGNMTLKIPESTSAELTASVTTGRIDISSLPLQAQSVSNTHISGRLNDGNGTIILQVITGRMTISGFVD